MVFIMNMATTAHRAFEFRSRVQISSIECTYAVWLVTGERIQELMEYSLGVLLRHFWSTFGVRLGHFWSTPWSTFGALLEYFWSTFGALLEHFWSTPWSTFGALLEYFWSTFGALLEYFWALLEYFCNTSGHYWSTLRLRGMIL